MLHLKVGVAAVSAAGVLHAMYVRQERSKTPTGRLLQFSPGSQDAIVAGGLKAGDVVRLSRQPVLYAGAAGVAVAARQADHHFDQTGVLVVRRGELLVAERTFTGVRLRPYEARVRASRSKEVQVSPAAAPLSRDAADRLLRYVAAAAEEDAGSSLPAALAQQVHAAGELLRWLAGGRAAPDPSLEFVAQALAAAHGTPPSDVVTALRNAEAGAAPPPTTPVALRWQRPIWVRDLR